VGIFSDGGGVEDGRKVEQELRKVDLRMGELKCITESKRQRSK
jgi:hypothetical protein